MSVLPKMRRYCLWLPRKDMKGLSDYYLRRVQTSMLKEKSTALCCRQLHTVGPNLRVFEWRTKSHTRWTHPECLSHQKPGPSRGFQAKPGPSRGFQAKPGP